MVEMDRKSRVYFRGGIAVMVAAMLWLGCVGAKGAEPQPAASQLYAAPQLEQVIAASCKVSVEAGRGERHAGSGCLYGYQVRGPVRRGLVVTAAHVVQAVGRGAVATLRFGRGAVRVTGRVIWMGTPRRVVVGGYATEVYEPADVAYIEFDAADWPREAGPAPRGVPFAEPDWQVPAGTPVYTLGYPSGANDIRLMSGRAKGYDDDGSMLVYPGPELGRSGSAVVAHDAAGKPVIVGILVQRGSPDGDPNPKLDGKMHTRLATPRMIWRSERRGQSIAGQETSDMLMAVGVEAQCPPGGCPPGQLCPVPIGAAQTVPQPVNPYRVIPYRQQNDGRIGRIENQVQRLDDQAERSPGTIPLPPVMPPVDLSPLESRVRALEGAVNAQAQRLGELGETERKAKELAEAVAKRDEGFAADLAAVRGEAVDAKKALAEATDEENPKGLFGRLKARLEDRFGGALGELPWLKWGGIGVALVIVYLLVKRDVRHYVESGGTDELAIQRGAALIPGRIGDMIEAAADRAAERAAAIYLRRHPDSAPPAPPAA